MTAASIIALSVLAVTLGGGLVYAMKLAKDERDEARAVRELYGQQRDLVSELEGERRDLIGKLAATDAQLKDATIRLEHTEQQRNQALAEARESIRKEIRSAPDAIAALNKIVAAGHAAATGVRRAEETKAATTEAGTSAGDREPNPLQITDLL